jgi:hypothetical protein
VSDARAQLLEDRGEAAQDGEFFRSAEFHAAEGVTHTLVIPAAEAELRAAVVVREIEEDEGRDATSPYGYPGLGGAEGERVEPEEVDFGPTGLISAFIRHSLPAEPPLLGATRRNTVLLADPELPRKSRMSDRQQIRRNLRRGYEARVVPGPESSEDQRAGYLVAYTETMRRTEAAPRYFFDSEYFDRVLLSPRSWLALAIGPEGEVAAGSVAVQSDGLLHYYLSGTGDAWLRDSPMKNVLAALTDLAEERGMPLNLGGGISPGDRLEEFKRGFANREEAWHTSELVCDPQAYERLSRGRDAGAYFPAYRAPRGSGAT